MAIKVTDYASAKALADQIRAAKLDPSKNGQIGMLLSQIDAVERERATSDVSGGEGTAVKIANKFAQNWNSQYEYDFSKLKTESQNIANARDISALSPEKGAEILSATKARVDAFNKSIETFNKSFSSMGFDAFKAPELINQNGYLEQTDASGAVRSAALAKTSIGKKTSEAEKTNTSAVTNAFQPTDYSTTNKLSDLQSTVMGTNSALKANDAFINGVFKAFHNRDATAAELKAYVGKSVGDVRTEIIGGAQAAGLPTVASGTVNVQTGILTPEQAVQDGLQKVGRPDQLSAFREDQIVRDNRGGIYLRTETTTQAQRDAVASGKSGNQIGTVEAPVVGRATAPAEDIERSSTAPDAETFVETFASSEGATAEELSTAITDTATSYLSSVISAYDKRLAALTAELDTNKAEMNTLTGRIETISTSTPNADALAMATEVEQLREKQARIVEIEAEIVTEKERLQLGLISEGNKLAPLSIIGARQATLQSQGLARIGALTAIAQIYQEDLSFAKSMVDATVTAMNADRTLQLNALDTLIELKGQEIINLTDEESAVVKARQDALNEAIDSAQKNADTLFELIKENPAAAVQGGVTLSDSPATALSKMAPYMAEAEMAAIASERKTQVVDQGGKKVLIDSATGEVIEEYTETESSKLSHTDITRDDGSVWRVYTDENGIPTGQTTELFPADTSEEFKDFTTRVSELVTEMNKEDSTTTWATARQTLKTEYPDVSEEVIDSWLGGGVVITQSKDWKNIDDFLLDYPGLKREAEYWKSQGDGDREIINLLENKYAPSFSDVGTDTYTGANSVAAVQKLTASFPPGTYAGQCGAFVNDVLGTRMGDSFESKFAKTSSAITADTVQGGDFFVMPYGDYGHTGVVVKKTPKNDGTYDILVLDSNYGLDERIRYHTINSSRISGYGRTAIKRFTSRYSV